MIRAYDWLTKGEAMYETIEIDVDWSEKRPVALPGLTCTDKERIIILHGGSRIRLSPSTVAEAFVKLCEHRMNEDYLDADKINLILKRMKQLLVN
jgi:hypothetical protein